jgi:hypothetical protein
MHGLTLCSVMVLQHQTPLPPPWVFVDICTRMFSFSLVSRQLMTDQYPLIKNILDPPLGIYIYIYIQVEEPAKQGHIFKMSAIYLVTKNTVFDTCRYSICLHNSMHLNVV